MNGIVVVSVPVLGFRTADVSTVLHAFHSDAGWIHGSVAIILDRIFQQRFWSFVRKKLYSDAIGPGCGVPGVRQAVTIENGERSS